VRGIVPAVLILASLSSGCRLGPEYHAPSLPEGVRLPWQSLNLTDESPSEPPDEWWALYEDPLLDRYIKEAFLANFDLKVAEADLVSARAVLTAAGAERYPQTQAQAGAVFGRDETTDEILELEGQAPRTAWLLGDVLQVNYEVDLWGRVHRTIEAAHADSEAVAAVRDAVRITIAAETARAYMLVCAIGGELVVARHSLGVVTREEDIIVRRHSAGASSNFDVVRAQGLVAQVRATLPPLEAHRRAALLELTALLGRTPSDAPREPTNCVVPPRLSSLIPVGDGATLIKRRPDVRAADRRLASATARIGVATADLYPKITLLGLFGGAGFSSADLISSDGLISGIGPTVSWTFPNQVIPRARVRAAKANATGALARFDATVLTALKEVEQSLNNYSHELERRDSLTLARHKAQEAFDLAHDMFLAGSESSLALLISEQRLVAADAAVADADTAILQNQISLFKSLGGGWQSPNPTN
jgi:NodT family efflux transporter outer membrane factor (OMF) lipoprotein